MDTYDSYECYVLGCRGAGLEPLEKWRFLVLLREFMRRCTESNWEQTSSPIPAFVLDQLELLVAQGTKIAAANADGAEPGAAAAGVHEPRVPREPVLSASAARSLPSADAADTSFWRT